MQTNFSPESGPCWVLDAAQKMVHEMLRRRCRRENAAILSTTSTYRRSKPPPFLRVLAIRRRPATEINQEAGKTGSCMACLLAYCLAFFS